MALVQWCSCCIFSIRTDAFIQAGYATIQTVVDASYMDYGLAFMVIARLGGIVLGLSISGAVFVSRAEVALQHRFPDVSKYTIVQAISGKLKKKKKSTQLNMHEIMVVLIHRIGRNLGCVVFDALSPDQQGLAVGVIVNA